MDRLSIAFITPEAVPFAKTGGLADISGVLPSILSKLGQDVRVLLPLYRQIREQFGQELERQAEFTVKVGDKSFRGDLLFLQQRKKNKDAEFYFIEQDEFFDRDGLYGEPSTGLDFPDNAERFIFFCRAAVQCLEKNGWKTDIIHLNDWQTALVAPFVRVDLSDNSPLRKSKVVFTIHNLAYQGQFDAKEYDKLGLPESYFAATGPFEFWGKVNFMKAALHFSDHITTVSPTYAREIISSSEYGMGLEGVLAARANCLSGILNGVDYKIWSPKVDKLIPFRYFPANLSGKKKNKLELVRKAGFPIRVDSPLFGMISRLDNQKGLDLIMEIFDRMMSLDIQFILLGTGDAKYMQFFRQKQQEYPDKFKAYLEFDNQMAHLIEAGADIFLMPSRYEPSGLNQMYSLKYGTVPLVRKTGGLADSVEDFDPDKKTGTGLVFEKYDADLLLATVMRGVGLYSRKKLWYKLMKAGMSQDFSWEKAATRYQALYRQLVDENGFGNAGKFV